MSEALLSLRLLILVEIGQKVAGCKEVSRVIGKPRIYIERGGLERESHQEEVKINPTLPFMDRDVFDATLTRPLSHLRLGEKDLCNVICQTWSEW
jgi:hypothetical protein